MPQIDLDGDALGVDPISITVTGDALAVPPISLDFTGDALAVDPIAIALVGDSLAVVGVFSVDLVGDAEAVNPTGGSLDFSGNAFAIDLRPKPPIQPPILPCPGCLPSDCGTIVDDDSFLYSLESQLFPFVINCPPGFNCQNATDITLLCCNQKIHIIIPPSATPVEREDLIRKGIAQCAVLLASCGDPPRPPFPPGDPNNPPPPPLQLYASGPQTCSRPCPDGNEFSYTLPAGSAIGLTQAQANQTAQVRACQLATEHKICLSSLPDYACIQQPFSRTIKATGKFLSSGVNSDYWSISGTIPPGLTATTGFRTQHTLVISGTPTTAGTYTFTVKVVAPGGESMSKTYTLNVVGITNTDPLPDALVGFPYSLQLTQSGFSEVEYSITGSPPSWLNVDSETGELSGTPDVGGVGFLFNICASGTLADGTTSAFCCREYALTVDDPFAEIIPLITAAAPVKNWNAGANLPAGNYTVQYVRGAMKYNPAQDWRLNANHTTSRFMIVHSGGTEVEFPGTIAEFATQALVEAANAGAQQPIVHTGGTIGMYLKDAIYGDNVAGAPNPTFKLIP